MKYKMLILLTVLLFAGCKVAKNEDGTKTYSIDPNMSTTIETGAEGAAGLLQGLTPFLGPSATIAGSAILAALGVWRKLKPKYIEAQNKAEVAHSVAGSMVDAIEVLKKDHPEDWKHLEPYVITALDASGIDTVVLDNVIRGLRGLPPKG